MNSTAKSPQLLGLEFDRYCETAAQFWPRNTLPAGEATILVELMTEDIRVSIRNLTIANAIRRFIPAQIVVYTGADEDWNEILWTVLRQTRSGKVGPGIRRRGRHRHPRHRRRTARWRTTQGPPRGREAYTLFPETLVGEGSFRMHSTRQIAEFFEQHLWANRNVLRRSAELTAWRSKSNLGRPSWWRGGGVVSSVEFRTPQERQAIRTHAMDRLGFDRTKPVVAIYNHATSDALNTNVEVFEDLGRWFEETAAFAAAEPTVNWLFVDHPSQAKYDSTGFFDRVAARHTDAEHLVFLPSLELSKNVMWSLVDLGVTVRGSTSAELPVYGIPAIQAGWSEWSGCGFTSVARDEGDYWRLLRDALAGLVEGRSLITEEQIERARLWLWFYRSGGDVASHLVQHWEMGQNEELFNALSVAMRQVESDGDAAFVSTQRMWSRQEPFLTRVDFARGPDSLNEQLGAVRQW